MPSRPRRSRNRQGIEVVVYEITQAAKRQADLFSEAAGVALE